MSELKTLIVGGAGFIGSHLARRFKDVIVLDNLFTGSKNNIPTGVEFIRHDVRNPYKIECDWIFNLACPASPIHYQRNPIKTINTAVMGAINALELAKEIRARVMQASTSEVYGDPTEHPQTESYWGNVNTIGTRSCYDEGKRCAETLFSDYSRSGVDVRIIRIFNCYSDDTEILTNNGYKLFKDLSRFDFVATLNPLNNTLEYEKPIDYYVGDYSGDMIEVKAERINLLVTPNHRLWVRKRWNRKYEFMTAEDALNTNGERDLCFKLNANWKGENAPEYFEIKKMKQIYGGRERAVEIDDTYKIPFKLWISFLAWYLSEGCVTIKDGARYTVDIRQTDDNNITEIADLVKSMGFNPSVQRNKNGRVRIDCKPLALYLKQFGKSADKYIPDYIKCLNKNILYQFILTYARGDGHIKDGKIICIISKSKRMIDDISEIALKCGYSATISKHGSAPMIYIRDISVEPIVKKKLFNKVYYKGLIYCVQTKNGILYVRRNGKSCWCGNTYGPRMALNDGRVVSNFIVQALKNQNLTVYGDGMQTRSFQYVDDLVDGMIMVMNSDIHTPVNLGNPVETTMIELATKIIELTNSRSEVVFMPLPADDPVRRCPDITLAKALGWEPKVSLEEGLLKTIEYFSWL